MNKYLYKITAVILVLVAASSCSDYLDVVPQDKIVESQAYSTEAGIQSVHNGLYIELASNDLYGKQLSMDAIEILGQQYNMPTAHTKYPMASYAYTDDKVKPVFSAIWEKAYKTILSANKFLESIEEHKSVISAEKANLLKGEAIAIRAMLHFDMLRLFGPVYKVAPSNPGVPYYDAPVAANNPTLPANQVITKVLADLDSALTLLKNDPVLTVGKYDGSAKFGGNPYYSMRGNRMNYVAVKCLKARVLLYAGDKAGAYAAANEVTDIADNTGFFYWTSQADATDSKNPDRTFSSENFFSLNDYSLYEKQRELFDYNLSAQSIYAPLLNRLDAVFESNDNDYRSYPTWKIPPSGAITDKTFYKYEDVPEKTKAFRFQIPMFKLSEMYLIAAETDPNPANGIAYLNTLRYNRGLVDLDSDEDVNTQVTKEYRREFIGEGQLFYYYKRNNTLLIPNGSSDYGNILMGALQYVVPLPDSEVNFK